MFRNGLQARFPAPRFAEHIGTFTENSWLAVLQGQGIMPEGHDPVADANPAGDMRHALLSLKAAVHEAAGALPDHGFPPFLLRRVTARRPASRHPAKRPARFAIPLLATFPLRGRGSRLLWRNRPICWRRNCRDIRLIRGHLAPKRRSPFIRSSSIVARTKTRLGAHAACNENMEQVRIA